jgi:hypothetical protein
MPQIAPMIIGIIGAGLSAYSTYQSGQNAKKVADYNAEINAQNAADARAKALSDANERMQEARVLKGKQKLAYAAAGVDTDSGTPLDTMMQTAKDAEMDAANIIKGGELTSRNYLSQAELVRYQGRATAQGATIGAGATILQGVGNAYGGYQKSRIPTTSTSSPYGVPNSYNG